MGHCSRGVDMFYHVDVLACEDKYLLARTTFSSSSAAESLLPGALSCSIRPADRQLVWRQLH